MTGRWAEAGSLGVGVLLVGVLMTGLPVYAQSSGVEVPTTGRFRALVVFVRFADDTSTGGCSPASRGWLDPDQLPSIAPRLLAASPEPPFLPTSLTAYFFQQSRGQFILYGDVFPRVVVTERPEAAYNIRNASSTRELAALSRELLPRLDPEVDFSRYDANDDGYVDHVFFVLRENRQPISWSGYSTLGPGLGDLVLDGMRVDGQLSGSYNRYNWAGNIIPEVNLVRLLAHEFGHDLWPSARLGGAHIQPVRGHYGVPVDASDRIGYALMIGAGGGRDMEGALTISSWERDLLGWIDCPPLRTDTTVVLGDLYTRHDCRTLAVPPGDGLAARTLYLDNRQRIGPFDRLRRNDCTDPPNWQGLKDTGLLVTAAEERRGGRARFAVVPADGTLELSIEREPYRGDLFGGRTAEQLTPWTRPNSLGLATYPPDFVMRNGHWQALDRIVEVGREVRFDYIADFRQRPVVRDDSWIGPEAAGTTIAGAVRIVDGSTLAIDVGPGGTLAFDRPLTVADGTLIVGGSGQEVVLEQGIVVLEAGRVVVRTGTTLRLGTGAVLAGEEGSQWRLEPGIEVVYAGGPRVRTR